jgi:hypothetical membrane protein
MHLPGHGTSLPLRTVSAACGMAAPLLFFLTAGILGMVTPGYDPVTQLISELGESGAPFAGVMNLLGFGVTGILILAFVPGPYAALGKKRVVAAGCGFIALAGALFVGMAFISCDRGCIPVTSEGGLHLILGLVAAIAAVAASFILAWPMRNSGRWEGIWQYSILTGILVLLLLPVFIAAGEFAGLLQRALVGIIFLWLEVIAIRTMTSGHGSRISPR